MSLAGNSVMSTIWVRSANNHATPSSTVSAQLSINSQHIQEMDTFITALEELRREARVNWHLPIGEKIKIRTNQNLKKKKTSKVIVYFVLSFSQHEFPPPSDTSFQFPSHQCWV